MVYKKLLKIKSIKLFSLALLLLMILPNISGAAFGSGSFCSSLFGLPQQQGITPLSANAILGLSLLVMLLMLSIAALTYLIGSAFRISRVANFGRTEIGEVALTALIVLIFLGVFQVSNTLPLPPPGNYVAISNTVVSGSSVFWSDCNNLASGGLTIIGDLAYLYTAQDYSLLAAMQGFSFTWSDFGWSDAPLTGMQMASTAYGTITAVLFALISVPFAGAIILGLFYYIAPVFLFLGILLRTLPFTRAAGGAFLGMFIAFYVLFPLLIYLLVSQTSVSNVIVTVPSLQDLMSGLNPKVPVLPSYADTGAGIIIAFTGTVIPQVMYILFALVLSLSISFDFMEAVGDLLGAPSLSSSHTLRNII